MNSVRQLSLHQCVPDAGDARRLLIVSLACLSVVLFFSQAVRADEVILKNGMILKGTALKVAGLTASGARQQSKGPVPAFSYWMIDDGVRRYFVYRRMVDQHVPIADLGANVSFELAHKKASRHAGFSTVGNFLQVQPFDEFGRRTVTLSTSRGEVPVIQAIKQLRPDFAVVESLTHHWEYCIDTKTLPGPQVKSIIAKSSNRDDPQERKAAVLFYVQAEMFPEALQEVQDLARRFPDLASWCEEYERQIKEYIATKAIHEIQRLQAAGQHRLAAQYAQQFPPDEVSASVRQEAAEVLQNYQQALVDRDRILLQLDQLQAKLPEKLFKRLNSMRAYLQDELHYESLPRLEPFLRALDDETLEPDKKLALAYSGWLLGNAQALLDLEETIRLWDARFLILEYLRLEEDADPLHAQELIQQISAIEGVSVERLAWMMKFLPLPFEAPDATAGTPIEVEIPTAEDEEDAVPVRYTVMLPPEYNPAHRYPLLVVLRGEHTTFEGELKWWAGDATRPGWAQRRGYITIAPHYCPEGTNSYAADSTAHESVLASIHHVRKRFRVDSDRIFLAGHGMGANACFDVALSHPGLFAGVVPITGIYPRFCRLLRDNDPHLSWYIVGGEFDRNALEENATPIADMMKHGQDIIFCDYKSRGHESYYEEQDRIFQWMQPLRRAPLRDSTEWEADSLRATDNTFYWVQAGHIPENLYSPLNIDTENAPLPRPSHYEAQIKAGGNIYINHPGKSTTVWLSPEIFDFDQRCRVRANYRNAYNDFVRPSIEALLSDVRQRGDRERLYWARLDL